MINDFHVHAKKMRKHNSLELPILVDDISPKTVTHDFETRMSIDLARRSMDSFSFEVDPPSVPPADLAVLEELESIRGLIERKSRDLKHREHSLSRSISTWNSEIATAQHLIEELANNLVVAGEKSMEAAFSKQNKKLQKLLDAVRHETKMFNELSRRRVLSLEADVPPVPRIKGGDSLSDYIMHYISESPSSTGRQVSAATILLLHESPLGENKGSFVENMLFSALREFVLFKFDALMISSVISDMQPTPDETRSKFASAKQSILKKRLGVGSNSTTGDRINLVLHSEYSASDKPIDIHQEIDGELNEVWTEVYDRIKGSALVYRSPLVKLLADQTVQQVVCVRMRQRLGDKSLKGQMIQVLMSHGIADKAILEVLQFAKKVLPQSIITHGTQCLISVFVMLLYMLHRYIEDAKSVDVTNAVCEAIGVMFHARPVAAIISQFLVEWPQGCWFAVKLMVNQNQATPLNDRITDCLCQILNSASDLSCIAPWHAIILDRLDRNLIHPSAIGSIKSLLKRLPS